MNTTCECTIENAPLFWEWVRNRGGVAVWSSVDLSNPNGFSTPALTDGEPTQKPHWRVAASPDVFTDLDKITVYGQKEVDRFEVELRSGAQGLTIKLTDESSDELQERLEKAGEGASYQFDYDCEEAVIFAQSETMTLQEWVDQHRAQAKVVSFDPRNGPK